jgi:hypothetical protein
MYFDAKRLAGTPGADRRHIRLQWLPADVVALSYDVERAISDVVDRYPELQPIFQHSPSDRYVFRRSFASTVGILEWFAQPVPAQQAMKWHDFLFLIEELTSATVVDAALAAACLHCGFDCIKESYGPYEYGGVCLSIDQDAVDLVRNGRRELIDLQLLGDRGRDDDEYVRCYAKESSE